MRAFRMVDICLRTYQRRLVGLASWRNGFWCGHFVWMVTSVMTNQSGQRGGNRRRVTSYERANENNSNLIPKNLFHKMKAAGQVAVPASLHPREIIIQWDQNSRECLTQDSVSYGSASRASDASAAGMLICGTWAAFAPWKSGAELFVSINHDAKPSAPPTAKTSIEMAVHTKGIRARARSTCNIAKVTIASSNCGRIKKTCKYKEMHNA
jgi:hypothetical protein